MQKRKTNRVSRASLFALLCALALTILSLSSCFEPQEPPSKDELYANIEQADGGYDTVARYLYEWEFPSFNNNKFLAVEGCVDSYYYEEIPSAYTLARATAQMFLEHCYDVVSLSDRAEVTDALLYCYIESLGDPYSEYRDAKRFEDFEGDLSGSDTFVGIGVQIKKTEEGFPFVSSVHNGSGAEAAGIAHGDIIVEVADTRVTTGQDSNYQQAVDMIRGEEGTTVKITVLRGGEELTLEPVRATLPEVTVNCRIKNQIAYIEILSFKTSTAEEFTAAVDYAEGAGVKGIVFDLRNNLGGRLATVTEMLSYLVEDARPIVSYQYKGEAKTVIKSTTKKGLPDHKLTLPSVVLMNEYTASAAEIFAAALRDYETLGLLRVTLVGKTTIGKGVMQSSFPMTDGSAVTLTVAYYDPPVGENYHGVGVEPEKVAEYSLTLMGGDSQLNVATEELEKLISQENN